MGLCFRLELRQCLNERDRGPENAIRGVKGLKEADKILKKYETAGILIGGVAKKILQGASAKELSRRKDVDVLVLSHECSHHPQQWEGDIDWWVSHGSGEGATNGNPVWLIWSAELKADAAPGLYLPPPYFLLTAIFHEVLFLGDKFAVTGNGFSDSPPYNEFPILPHEAITVRLGNLSQASYC